MLEEVVGNALRVSSRRLVGCLITTEVPTDFPLLRFDAVLIELVLVNRIETPQSLQGLMRISGSLLLRAAAGQKYRSMITGRGSRPEMSNTFSSAFPNVTALRRNPVTVWVVDLPSYRRGTRWNARHLAFTLWRIRLHVFTADGIFCPIYGVSW